MSSAYKKPFEPHKIFRRPTARDRGLLNRSRLPPTRINTLTLLVGRARSLALSQSRLSSLTNFDTPQSKTRTHEVGPSFQGIRNRAPRVGAKPSPPKMNRRQFLQKLSPFVSLPPPVVLSVCPCLLSPPPLSSYKQPPFGLTTDHLSLVREE